MMMMIYDDDDDDDGIHFVFCSGFMFHLFCTSKEVSLYLYILNINYT